MQQQVNFSDLVPVQGPLDDNQQDGIKNGNASRNPVQKRKSKKITERTPLRCAVDGIQRYRNKSDQDRDNGRYHIILIQQQYPKRNGQQVR